MNFLRKPSGDSLQSLNEEEIQKKLYGTFHKNTASPSSSVTFNRPQNVPFTRPKRIEKPAFNVLVLDLKIRIGKLIKMIQSFPWKFFILVTGCVLLFIYAFQFLSGAIQHVSKTREAKQQAKLMASQSTGQSTTTLVPSQGVLSPPNQHEKLADPVKKSYYAVQICTYQKENDAKALANELKNSNFSAFYQRMQGGQNKTPYYVVFLGKNESYAGANEKLKEFRSSDQYQKFPDAFIRSI